MYGFFFFKSVLYTKSHSTIHSFSFPLKHLTPMTESNWIPYYRPHPLGPGHYDFFTDHVRFNETCVRHFLPNDTIFISSVREPLDNFVSAFYYNGYFPRTLPGEQLPAIHFLFPSNLTLLYFCLPLLPLGASLEERDVCLLHWAGGMLYRDSVSLTPLVQVFRGRPLALRPLNLVLSAR